MRVTAVLGSNKILRRIGAEPRHRLHYKQARRKPLPVEMWRPAQIHPVCPGHELSGSPGGLTCDVMVLAYVPETSFLLLMISFLHGPTFRNTRELATYCTFSDC